MGGGRRRGRPIVRRLLITLLACLLAVGAASCSDDGDDESSDTTPETTVPGPAVTEEDPDEGTVDPDADEAIDDALAEGDDEYPCNVLDAAETEEMFGSDGLPPDATTTFVDENGQEWEAAACSWTTFDETATEASLQVSVADDFPDGQVACPTMASATGEVPGVGDSNQWSWVDAGTTVTVGELRVCTADALIDVDVSGTDPEAGLQAFAVTLAEAALARL
jgi:hypothetical protein